MFEFEQPASSLEEALLKSRTRYCWYLFGGNDYTDFNFDVVPEPWMGRFVHVWPSQWQRDGGVYLAFKRAKERQYHFCSDQSVVRKPDHTLWKNTANVKSFDYSWHPDPHEPDYEYHFPTQRQSAGGPVYPGTQGIKLCDAQIAQVTVARDHWHVPKYIDDTTIDWEWHPNPLDPPYVYHFPSQHQSASGVTYTVPGATDIKLVDDFVVRSVYADDNWSIARNIDRHSVDFTWHPNVLDEPYTYHFPSQWQSAGGASYHVGGATKVKLVDDFVVRAIACEDTARHWHIPDYVDPSSVDQSWHPNPFDPGYIYHFPSQHQSSSGVTYTCQNATEIKMVDDQVVQTIEDTEGWTIPQGVDKRTIDFTWRPNPLDPPYIYHFPSQHQNASGVAYTVPGATEIKFVDDFVVMLLEETENWTIPDYIDRKSVDLTWKPNPLDPPYVYHFPSQHQPASGVTYRVAGATEPKIVDAMIVRALEVRDNWIVPDEIDPNTVDFSWHPDVLEPPYVYHFPSEWQASSGLEYHTPQAIEIKIAEDYPTAGLHDFSTRVSKVLDIFYVDYFNASSQQRWERIEERYPTAQKIRYANSLMETVRRCCTRSSTGRFWVISSECIYDDFDFSWHPESWQRYMTHVFGSQWQKWSDTFLINRSEFERNSKWANSIEEFPNLNFVNSQPVLVPDDLHDIVYVDWGNPTDQFSKLKERYPNVTSTRFVSNYLDTFKRIINSHEGQEYIWIVNSVCDYSRFDFSWQPEPWQREMLHIFPSNNQRRGDTFYVHVPTFKQQMDSIEILDWFETINYCSEQQVQRLPMPTHTYTGDSMIKVINEWRWGTFPYGMLAHEHASVDMSAYKTPCLWRAKDRTVISLTHNNDSALVPRDIHARQVEQVYDYPYIDKTQVQNKRDLDIVFISNGETDADRWYEHLCACVNNPQRVKRIDGVNGRIAAYQAAAQASSTDWFFAVFAKIEVNPDFDWSWQPDYFQEAKHYIFYARNPVNGLEYGHMGVIAYNKRLTLDTNESGLDFTLSRAHEVVPILSGTAHYNADAWMTWRTAFRETLKLRQFIDDKPSIETEGRLRAWLRKGAEVTNGEWSIRGAQDALTFYESVDGNPAELQKSFDWPWLRNLFESNQ